MCEAKFPPYFQFIPQCLFDGITRFSEFICTPVFYAFTLLFYAYMNVKGSLTHLFAEEYYIVLQFMRIAWNRLIRLLHLLYAWIFSKREQSKKKKKSSHLSIKDLALHTKMANEQSINCWSIM